MPKTHARPHVGPGERMYLQVQADAEALRAKAADYQGVLDATLAYEAAAAAIQKAQQKSVGVQLGEVLKSKGLKVGDVVERWGGKDGSIDKEEFREQTMALGIDSDPKEIDALFDSLDGDGGGTLDLAEVKEAFRNLIEESSNAKQHIRNLRAELADREKEARSKQTAWKKQRKAEEKIAAEENERRAQEDAAAAFAAEEAKEAKARANAEKKAAAAAEKAAFDARIAAKRAGKGGGTDEKGGQKPQ